MSELPDSWWLVKLDDIANWGSGGTPSRKNPAYFTGTIPWLKTGELGPKTVRSTEEHISEEALKNSAAKMYPAGAVCIAMYGATIGKASILGIEAATNQACAVGVPHDGATEAEFLYYFLLSEKRSFIKAGIGGAQPNISQGLIRSWPLPLPPLAEQKRIVAKIEELFSELDAGEESLRRARRQLVVYRQSLLKQAFEGKLTAPWRAQHLDLLESPDQLLARIQAERQARYQQQLKEWESTGKRGLKPRKPKLPVPLTADEFATLPKVPAEWCWEKNERYLFEVKDGTHDTPKYVDDGIPFITQKHIQDGKIVFDDFKLISIADHERFSERSNVEHGDLLISMIGRPGNCAIVRTGEPFSIKNVGLFKFFENLQSNQFLFYFYQSQGGLSYIMRFAKGGLQPFLGLKELRFWPVPVCSLPEQQEIVRLLDEQFEVIEQNEREIDAALKRSEALRQSILKKAFTGQLVPQAPTDEPASVLLERIRAEREAAAKPAKKQTTKKARS